MSISIVQKFKLLNIQTLGGGGIGSILSLHCTVICASLLKFNSNFSLKKTQQQQNQGRGVYKRVNIIVIFLSFYKYTIF